jgi:predicted small integral membrane protein
VLGVHDNDTATRGVDRRRDVLGWVLTPLVTLLLGPAVAASVGVLAINGPSEVPALCENAAANNRCEETTLGMLAEHVVLFGLLWLLLWLTPWWRGLRTARIVLAVIACVVLLVAPLRMAEGLTR